MNELDAPQASILIVDDEPANLRLLTAILADQGYVIRSVRDGHMALASATLAPPDLILLDILMPVMDGYQVCEQLKADKRTRDIPVLFLSAIDRTLDKIKAFSLGAVDYISKPFRVEEVVARIELHLNLRNLQKQLEERNVQLEEIDIRQQTEETRGRVTRETTALCARSLRTLLDTVFTLDSPPGLGLRARSPTSRRKSDTEEHRKTRIFVSNAMSLSKAA